MLDFLKGIIPNFGQSFTGGSFQSPNYLMQNSNMANYGVNPNPLVPSVNPLEQFDASTYGNESQFNTGQGFQTALGSGGSGNWLSNIFSPSQWTPGGMSMASSAMGMLGSGVGIFNNMRNYGLAKDALDMQKKYAAANLYNQAASSNNALRERAMLTKARWGVNPKYQKAKSTV